MKVPVTLVMGTIGYPKNKTSLNEAQYMCLRVFWGAEFNGWVYFLMRVPVTLVLLHWFYFSMGVPVTLVPWVPLGTLKI